MVRNPRGRNPSLSILVGCLTAVVGLAGLSAGGDNTGAIREAIETGLSLVQDAARRYPEHRDCFSCHHQTLPMLAMVTAREKGFAIDAALLSEQAAFTRDFYGGRIESVRNGEGVGGRGMTAGYALWALDLADEGRDAVTDALVTYLRKTQTEEGRWKRQSLRPPLEETDVTATVLASTYLDRYGPRESVRAAVESARSWVEDALPQSQEGQNFQYLAALRFAEWEGASRRALRQGLLAEQRADGGWGQVRGMASDAYATGQTLFVLQESLAADPASDRVRMAIAQGVEFLLKSRQADGSWHVVTRSKPVQRYFDNGDPHGVDQFISTPATAWAVAALAATLPTPARAPDLPPVSFNRDVRPILSDNCYQCHGPDRAQRKAGLRLDQRAETIKLRENGRVVVPARPAESLLVSRVRSTDPEERMPPPHSERILSEAEKTILERWIAAGADYEPHWAFIAPKRPPLPEISGGVAWGRNAIDAFILRRLREDGLSPAREASKQTLIRRVTLDLTGLPPTPGEIDAFLADSAPTAYDSLVDRLLRSPRYGEHMASSWLDAARYSDTNGYNNDTPRYNWRYRDWVIEAYNRNLPFDRFLTEQLAGDLLPEASLDAQIATGFNRNHNVTSEGGIIDEEYRLEYVADRVDTTATVFMALTLSCARCHDHKFDSISQRDYYRFFAFFNQVPEAGYHKEHVGNPHPVVPAPTAEQARSLRQLEDALANAHTEAQRERLEKEKAALQADVPTAMVMRDQVPPRETFILQRGAYDRPGDKVAPAVPAIFSAIRPNLAANRLGLAEWLTAPDHPLTARVAVNRLWHQIFGRGIVTTLEDFGSQGAWPSHPELLDWLATEFIRLGWDQKALLRTLLLSASYRQDAASSSLGRARDPDNVLLWRGPRYRLPAEVLRDSALYVSGLLGERMGGPSVKPYQPPGLWTEVIVADDSYSGGEYVQDQGADLYRRSVYTWWKRTCPPPGLSTFDAPDREFCTVQRARTNTPLQALVLLNDPTYVEAARVLATQLLREFSDPGARLVESFRRLTGRSPSPEELPILQGVVESERAHFAKNPAAASALLGVGDSDRPEDLDPVPLATWTFFCSMLLNLDEAITQH